MSIEVGPGLSVPRGGLYAGVIVVLIVYPACVDGHDKRRAGGLLLEISYPVVGLVCFQSSCCLVGHGRLEYQTTLRTLTLRPEHRTEDAARRKRDEEESDPDILSDPHASELGLCVVQTRRPCFFD